MACHSVNGDLSHKEMEKLCYIVQLTELIVSNQQNNSDNNNIDDSDATAIAYRLKNLTIL
jgi:hypothetical protein